MKQLIRSPTHRAGVPYSNRRVATRFGVKTFLVNHEGTVWKKDLGPGTKAIASAIQCYAPDKTWQESPRE